MAILRSHLERVLDRKVKRHKLTQYQADFIKNNPKAAAELTKRVNGLAVSEGFKAIGDGKILQWIIDHWDQIYAIIQVIIKLFGG